MTVNEAKTEIKAHIRGWFTYLSDAERLTVLRDLIPELTRQEEDILDKMNNKDDES